MGRKLTVRSPRGATVIGLVIGAIGIAMLWAAGVEFPFYPPPGLLILLAGAVFVAVGPWRWAPLVGLALGLFVLGGFILSSVRSGAGTGNLLGAAGIGGTVGTLIQLLGVITAIVAGVIATRREWQASASSTGVGAEIGGPGG